MKHLFKIFLTLVCGAALTVGCTPDALESMLATQLSTDVGDVNFVAQSASTVSVKVTANGDWISVGPDWITVTPSYGSGNTDVVLSAADNFADGAMQGPRSGKVTFLGADPVSAVVNISQEGDNSLDQRRTYVKVDKAQGGKSYLFVVKKADGSYIIPTLFGPNGTYGYPKPLTVELADDGSIQFEDNSNGLTFTEVEGGFTIQQPDGRYIWHQSGYNTWSVAGAPTEGNIWKVEPQSDGTVKIIDIQNGGLIQYGNGGFDSFAAYASMDATAILPSLYEDTKAADVLDMLVAEATEVTVTNEATQAEFKITSTVDWKAVCTSGETWVKSFSESGSGSDKFIVTFDPYTGEDEDRTATFVLAGGDGLTLKLTLTQQKVVSVVPIKAAAFNALPADDAGTYQIGGLATDVPASGNGAKYGNFYIEDHTGKVYIYGLLTEKGGASGQSVLAALGVKEGDFIEVAAPHTVYKDAAQGKNAWVLNHYPLKTVEEFNALEDSEETRYTLKVEVTKINNDTYGNFEFKDATGTGVTYTCYDFDGGYKMFKNLGLEVGDVIVFHALKTTYKGTIQAKNCQPVVIIKGGGDEPDPGPVSSAQYASVTEITEALAAAKGFLIAAKDGDVWHVAQALDESKTYGYLNYIDVPAGADGQLTISDPTCVFTLSPAPNCWYIQDVYGRYLYMSGTYNSFNVSATLPESGAEWTIEKQSDGSMKIINDDKGKYIQCSTKFTSFGSYVDEQGLPTAVFSGAREISGGGDEPGPGPQPGTEGGSGTYADPYTVDGAIAYIKSIGDKESTEDVFVKGKISSIKYTFSAQYGTATFNISADGSTEATQFTAYSVLYLGNVAWTEGCTQVAVGDEVVLYGKVTNYKGTYETSSKKAFIYSLNGHNEGGYDPGPGPQPGTEGGSGTQADPYNVDGAIAFVKANGDKETADNVFVKGKISSIKYTFSEQYGTATFDISADGTTEGTQFTAYSVLYLGNVAWTEGCTQVAVGDEVVLYGKLTNYKGTYETSSKKAFIYSLNGKSEGGIEPTPGPGPDEPEPEPGTTMAEVNWESYFNAPTENLSPLPESRYTIDGITYTFDKAGGSNAPSYYVNNSSNPHMRLYEGNTLTVTAPSGMLLTRVQFVDAHSTRFAISPSSGAMVTSTVWQGGVNSVTFTVIHHSGGNGRADHEAIKVSYVDEGSFSLAPCINEVWPARDKVELYNPGNETVDITGWTLTNGSDSYTIPASKGKVTAGDHVMFNLPVDGMEGFEIVLKNAAGAQIEKLSNTGSDRVLLNEVSYSRESYGRAVDGISNWVVFSQHSMGTSNDNGEIEIRGFEGVLNALPLTDQAVTLIDPFITYADDRYAIIQEGETAGLLDKAGHGYKAGDKFAGFNEIPDFSAKLTNQNLILTSCTLDENARTTLAELPAETMTVAQVKSGIAKHLLHRVVLEDVTVARTALVGDNGSIAQGNDTIPVVTLVPVELLAEGAKVNKLVAFPYYVNKKAALLVFELPEENVAALGTYVRISATELTAPIGGSCQLTAETNSTEPIRFYSTTPAIAEISSSGVITGVQAGECEVVAYVEANGPYSAAEARCLVTVRQVSSVADIKNLYDSAGGQTSFSAKLTDALVTYVSGSNFYLEDATGAILGYSSGHGLVAGDLVNGMLSGKVTKYQGNYEITNLDKSGATITAGTVVTPTSIAADALAAGFASYESRYVEVPNVTIAGVSGKNITVSETSDVIFYSNAASPALPPVGSRINVRGLVTYYNATKEVKFFSVANDIDTVALVPTITAVNRSVAPGDTIHIDATTNSTASVTYVSSDPAIATVGESTGIVTGLAEGSVTITCSVAAEGMYLAASKDITVTVAAGAAPGPSTPTLVYTLDGITTGGSSGYATESDITQNSLSWKVTGNTTISPWRIGGKSISAVDKPVYSTGKITDDICKIVIEHGTASGITVNSMTVIVSTVSDFSSSVTTVTPTFTAEGSVTVDRPAGKSWANCYYKIVYNVTVSANSNKYFQLKKIEFYK